MRESTWHNVSKALGCELQTNKRESLFAEQNRNKIKSLVPIVSPGKKTTISL